jgi:hypothetical protein
MTGVGFRFRKREPKEEPQTAKAALRSLVHGNHVSFEEPAA